MRGGRDRSRWLTGVVGCVLLAGCARQVRPNEPAPPGIERSSFPLLVADGSPGMRGRYRACTATYVAPHVLATSSGAFPVEEGGVQVVDLGGITILDGTDALTIEHATFVDAVPGLVLLRTREPGTPIALRFAPVADGTTLRRVGHRFSRAPRRGFLPYADWSIADAIATTEDTTDATGFAATTELHPGLCGAPVFDAGDRLAGIIRGGSGNRAAIVDAIAIGRALRGTLR